MAPQTTLSPRAWTEMMALALIWGASFLAMRIALDEIGPLTAVSHRVVWAALLLWVWVWLRGYALPRGAAIWIGFLGMGILNNAIPFTLMAWGQLHIPTGLTAILNAATAIFGVIAAAIFFADERLTLRRAAGVLLGFAGVTTAIGPGALLSFDVTSLAQLAVIAGTVSYALAGVWARKRLRGLRPEVAAAGMLTVSSVVMLPLAWAVEGRPSLDLRPETWAAIGYFAVVATALAFLLYYRVLAMVGAGNLMLVTLLIPPVAIVLGAWVRDEALSGRAYAGFAVLALGLALLDGRILARRAQDRPRRA